ncbi:MAG: FKBP-type peptidyl-prolyl cis-trans isomerase [Caldilineaceae bacterium]|nr:FKBP-type peptidyl-prolyl cis-trans isomerase [Caldilineaceae bacterium]
MNFFTPRRRPLPWLVLAALALLSAGCAANASQNNGTVPAADASADASADNAAGTVAGDNAITTESGLQYVEEVAGDGRAAEAGDKVFVHYTGMLDDGTVFDSSYDRGQPISFVLGMGQVISGWDEGIDLMAIGGKARLIIPPELAYGATGAGGVIPPDATLTFDVELVDVQDGPPGSPDAPEEVADDAYVTTDSGLQYADLVEGEGEAAQAGDTVVMNYTGWLEDGTKFDSSLDRGDPFVFTLGAGQVIQGWDEGIQGMKPGGKRQLVIPAELGYGDRGAGGVIPPGATLIFDVEYLGTP